MKITVPMINASDNIKLMPSFMYGNTCKYLFLTYCTTLCAVLQIVRGNALMKCIVRAVRENVGISLTVHEVVF